MSIISYNSVAQTAGDDTPGRWFFGIEGGTTFGQCTFRSITDNKTNIGGSAGVFGGYGFNSIFALEGAATFGSTKLTAQDCDPFWLSMSDGQPYYAPVIDQTGDFYKNITAKPKFTKFALQLDIDFLKLFTGPCSKLSLSIAPQISAVITKNKLTSDLINNKYDQQSHFGYGAQAAFGFFVAQKVQVQIFGGITALSGDRIDNIPKHHHESNLIWDAGIKIAYRLRRTCGEKPIPPYTDNEPSNINNIND
ncbi:MAG: outer membrane beta-barrel protein, partial [Bacteroidales bacterium]|nr:outer membrane beta-barrel protein [Bacteroidales bacterium]